MPETSNHYHTLEISPDATQKEIDRAYRRLAKEFHPDCERGSHEKMVSLNVAYEVLGNPENRSSYDRQRYRGLEQRQQRSAAATANYYRQRRRQSQDSEAQLDYWLQEVFAPVNAQIEVILNPLEREIDDLAADPFDDALMAEFEHYLQTCRDRLERAKATFTSRPNPARVAAAAANLYYCLNQIGDGLEELQWFTLNYQEHYLHTGIELFRIADRLRADAREAIGAIGS